MLSKATSCPCRHHTADPITDLWHCCWCAGDPIEVGAIAEVFLSSSIPQARLLSLSSSKSWYGHAEPGAGMVGVAHALLAHQQQAVLPIMHLRSLNPMVASMLEAAGTHAATRGLKMPRQAGPSSVGASVMPRTGISAFAFQVRDSHLARHVKH
jgi:acyl transferase domain-containing protein